jgi:hypothetical protein
VLACVNVYECVIFNIQSTSSSWHIARHTTVMEHDRSITGVGGGGGCTCTCESCKHSVQQAYCRCCIARSDKRRVLQSQNACRSNGRAVICSELWQYSAAPTGLPG